MLCSVSGVFRPLEASVLWRWDALPTVTIQLEGKELGKGLSSLPSLQAEISWLQAHRKLPGSRMLSGKLSWWPALLSVCPSVWLISLVFTGSKQSLPCSCFYLSVSARQSLLCGVCLQSQWLSGFRAKLFGRKALIWYIQQQKPVRW